MTSAANGEAFEVLKRTTWGYATNPNMAGVLVVGLGCEGFQIARISRVRIIRWVLRDDR